MQRLQGEGIPYENILGIDSSGIPILCGNGLPTTAGKSSPATARELPSGSRSWEAIPCVIRDDGIEDFRLEVNVNGPVQAVRMPIPNHLKSDSGEAISYLKDDGLSDDRVADDKIFTSERFVYNTNTLFAIPFYLNDTNSPAGLQYAEMHSLQIIEEDGTTNQFVIIPTVGVLDKRIPATGQVALPGNAQVSPHLVNVQTSGGTVQGTMRNAGGRLDDLTFAVYAALPDDFDFLLFISTDHIEAFPFAVRNLIAGMNFNVQINFSGSGQTPYDTSSYYGSAGRLKSLNLLDTGPRGVYCNNATHEMMHQWSAFLSPGLGLNNEAHYENRSNIGSILGGQLWTDTGSNTFIMNCEEGRSGLHHAPPLDKYMMGLIEAGAVPLSRVYSDALPNPLGMCGEEFSELARTVMMDEIIASAGSRVPGPATAQRNFSLGFVAESRDRLLNATEMTFYETLAAYYTKPVPEGEPDPYLIQNWVPITRFFGEGTTWNSSITAVVRPILGSPPRLDDGVPTISGVGFPGETYAIQASTNLISWDRIGTAIASTNGGAMTFTDNTAGLAPHRFYRFSWP